jgi:exopolysaccharide/PEP-CTERM locus tyrosine autokinase
MSLVERALKKLQESRGTLPAESARSAAPAQPAKAELTHPVSHSPQPTAAPVEPIAPQTPRRTVVIDRNALRAMQLLPPPDAERLIASQYQRVKRPLVASALGKSATPIANGHLIMLASALAGEGKTFTSINLALSLALEKDIKVLLVDADVAKPHVSRIFNLQAEPGLLDLLVDSTLHPESLILPTDVPGLSILPAGRQIETATELLASKRMEQVVAQLGSGGGHRIVLFDSPPLLLSTESRAIVPVVGQVVLVVRAEITPQQALMDALEIVGDAKPVSLILNQSKAESTNSYYGYGYGYGDQPPGPSG